MKPTRFVALLMLSFFIPLVFALPFAIEYQSYWRTERHQIHAGLIIKPLEIEATIDLVPDTLYLDKKGKWVSCYIELPEGYNVIDIAVSTIMLNDTVQAELKPTSIGDYDSDGIADLMVKFERAKVMPLLKVGLVTLTVTGEVKGTPFEGSDTIKVIG